MAVEGHVTTATVFPGSGGSDRWEHVTWALEAFTFLLSCFYSLFIYEMESFKDTYWI